MTMPFAEVQTGIDARQHSAGAAQSLYENVDMRNYTTQVPGKIENLAQLMLTTGDGNALAKTMEDLNPEQYEQLSNAVDGVLKAAAKIKEEHKDDVAFRLIVDANGNLLKKAGDQFVQSTPSTEAEKNLLTAISGLSSLPFSIDYINHLQENPTSFPPARATWTIHNGRAFFSNEGTPQGADLKSTWKNLQQKA